MMYALIALHCIALPCKYGGKAKIDDVNVTVGMNGLFYDLTSEHAWFVARE
jgi:hypothetical protein